MVFRDIIELAFQRFRTRSLRFFLTIFGVSIGIAVVFFLVSLGFGLQEVVIGRISTSESLSSLTILLPEGASGVLSITNETLDSFRAIPNVEDTSPLLSLPTEMSFNNLKAQTLAQAVHPSYFRYSGIEATGGQLFTDEDPYQIVASSTVFRLFGLSEEEAVGKELSLTFVFPPPDVAPDQPADTAAVDANIVSFARPFRIAGYIEDETNSIYVPLSLFKDIPNPSYTQVKVRINNTENINPVRDTLVGKGFTVAALTDTLDQLNRIFQITQATLATLGVIALFISSVGMFNTLTISLLERTQEVGILKAIGATNLDVWKIFLFEALLIAASGGVVGVLGGIAFSQAINFIVNRLAVRYGGQSVSLFHSPLWFIAAILSISVLVGLLTGMYPARRAAKLNPLDALRRE